MKFNTKLIALGVTAFLLFLIISAPASLITGAVASNSPVKFVQVSGSVWHGRSALIVGPQFTIGPVEWTLHPWYLLRGELAADIVIHDSTTSGDIAGSTWAAVGLPGVIKLRDTNINAGAEWAFALAAIPIAPRGRINVQIKQLEARRGTLPEITGMIDWQNAGVTYPDEYDLGAYSIRLQNEPENKPERVVAHISDQNSPLHVQGQATLQADGNYQLDVRLSADPTAPPDIARVLPMLGRAQSDGSVRIQRNGKLNDFM